MVATGSSADENRNATNDPGPTAPDVTPNRIELTGVSKRYGGIVALNDVHLTVRPGEVHALLGENGAGKSTLINVASGTTEPDRGTITFDGVVVDHLTPRLAADLGIAVVHQHPAVMADLTVAENLRVAVPKQFLDGPGGREATMRAMLDDVGFTAHLEDRVENLGVAEKHLLELAKALAVKPRLLILDEPTAPLGRESVDMLFSAVRSLAADGVSVVYITHRLAEVREIADRVTVLRDGIFRGEHPVTEVTDDDLLALIVGRQLEYALPPKHQVSESDNLDLLVDSLSGDGFHDFSLQARSGEIVGIAGIVGNGQSDLLRALAGLDTFDGRVEIKGRSVSASELRSGAAYMPADRKAEGLFGALSVRENASVSALPGLRGRFLLSRTKELEAVRKEFDDLRVKTPSVDSSINSLSGGNQQKVVMSRALLAQPLMLVADEPTQGVDVGARAEIYRILREVSLSGVPVVVASSDAKELEGLCDRVIVMSSGESVAELTGDDITEDAIVGSAIRAHARTRQETTRRRGGSTRRQRFLRGDYAPVAVLAMVMVGLGAYVYQDNDRYLSAFNTTSVQMLVAALGFIALGQTICLLIGGIDLSVGPLAGFLVVVGSFFMTIDKSGAIVVVGLLVMLAVAAFVGLVNGGLVRFAGFTAVAATLAMFVALQGMALVLRDVPGGYISRSVTDAIAHKFGRFPLVFILLVVVAVLMEVALRRTRWGLRLRAVGSDQDAARKVGIRVTRTMLGAYVLTSVFVFLGSVILLAQLGIGDPLQGEGYTLTSIAAVVLGGTSLLGGRGTFVGTFLGAGLSIQVLNATVFLGLSQAWVYFFEGALIVAAAVIYSQVRGRLSARTT
ncbi:ATP-binding cassette domain-containing protein [Candidatus Poriferisocius sp.]|uniref:ATP-binding cassette domain-containing protein n=1 Tax=Candidatus Poriferisocius sp. TaxID=3101276 RepID=UPI003B5C6186